jgi:hypothetical protein
MLNPLSSTQDTVVSGNISIVPCLWSMDVEYSDTRKVSVCLLATVWPVHREPVIVRSGPGGAAFGAARRTELETSSWTV